MFLKAFIEALNDLFARFWLVVVILPLCLFWCVYECVTLWDHLGDHLSQVFPDPAKIIELVVVSADANEVFDR